MRVRSREMIAALANAGADVMSVEAERPPSAGLEAFEPDFVVAPNLNYLLQGALDEGSAYSRLSRPPVMLWDDPLGALSLSLIQERGGTLGWLNEPSEHGDILGRFRALMATSGARHFSWDSGHIAAATELGLVAADSVQWYEIATYQPFLDQGRRRQAEPTVDVAFAGNVYEGALSQSNFAIHPGYAPIAETIRARKLADLSKSGWHLFREAIAELSVEDREHLGLEPIRTQFWDFYLYVIWLLLTTAVRVDLLSNVDRPVHMYGLFADPESQGLLRRHSNLVYAGHVDHFNELPQAFAKARVNICISNGLIYEGVPSKFVDCLASGGFALVDPKDDLTRLFGPKVEAIVFRDADDLNTKIEYYLQHPAERREIVEDLRQTIGERCTLDRLFERVLAVADAWD